MSVLPEASASREISRLIAAVRSRLIWLAAFRAATIGATAALVCAIVMLFASTVAAAAVVSLAIALLCALIASQRMRHMSAATVASAIEARTPLFRNTLVTSVELTACPGRAAPYIADRVHADAARAASTMSAADLFPLRRPLTRALVALLPVVVVIAVAALRPDWVERVRVRTGTGASNIGEVPGRGSLEVDVTVVRPTYTRLPPLTLHNPDRIQALDGSRLAFSVSRATGTLRVRTNTSGARPVDRDAGGMYRVDLPLQTGYVVLEGETPAERHLVSLIAVPDAAPSVRLVTPGRDLLYPDAVRTVSFTISASDDLELRALRLQYTKASGSGETFEFNEGDIPIDITRRDTRTWDARARVPLGALGLAPGDTLVYRASATDARADGVGVSDAYVIEIGKKAEGLAEGFAIGDDQNKYAISQQMVIMKTERLHAQRGSLSQDGFSSESQAIAAEQRMVRAEFVFMMGGEVEDEEVEAEQSHELQEGRLENRGQSDLRTAIRLMSDAERDLVASNTTAALPIERAALAALEHAFSRTRYILKTLSAQNRIDLSRRLSGNRSGAVDWTRQAARGRDGTMVAPLRAILGEIVALSGIDRWNVAAARRSADLAERLLSAASGPSAVAQGSGPAPSDTSAVQSAVRHLLDASRRATGTSDLARVRDDLQGAATILEPLARRGVGSPPQPSNAMSPAVRGVFADALATRGPR